MSLSDYHKFMSNLSKASKFNYDSIVSTFVNDKLNKLRYSKERLHQSGCTLHRPIYYKLQFRLVLLVISSKRYSKYKSIIYYGIYIAIRAWICSVYNYKIHTCSPTSYTVKFIYPSAACLCTISVTLPADKMGYTLYVDTAFPPIVHVWPTVSPAWPILAFTVTPFFCLNTSQSSCINTQSLIKCSRMMINYLPTNW
jgi:hypothetical protein